MTQQWKRDQIGAWFWSRSDLAEEFVVTEFGVGSGLKGSPMGWAASVDTTAMLLRPSRRQSLRYPKRALRRTFIAFLLMLSPTIAFAQTDEIQVYDAEIAAPGVYNLMVHNNYAFDGLKRFRGFQVGSGVPEWGLWRHGLVRAGFVFATLQRRQQSWPGSKWIQSA
jgi:hypothetical protein